MVSLDISYQHDLLKLTLWQCAFPRITGHAINLSQTDKPLSLENLKLPAFQQYLPLSLSHTRNPGFQSISPSHLTVTRIQTKICHGLKSDLWLFLSLLDHPIRYSSVSILFWNLTVVFCFCKYRRHFIHEILFQYLTYSLRSCLIKNKNYVGEK